MNLSDKNYTVSQLHTLNCTNAENDLFVFKYLWIPEHKYLNIYG